jgi:hypothetical protein
VTAGTQILSERFPGEYLVNFSRVRSKQARMGRSGNA